MAYMMLWDTAFQLNFESQIYLCQSHDFYVKALYYSFWHFFTDGSQSLKEDWGELRGFLYLCFLKVQMFLIILVSLFTAGFCYDLIKTLKNPIDRYEGRLRHIVISSAIICCSYVIAESFIFDYLSSTLLREIGIRTKITYTNKFFAVLVYAIEIYYIVKALQVAFKRLFIRKGLNKEVRNKIIGR